MGRIVAEDPREELGDLLLAEGEHRRVEVEHLTPAAQSLNGKGGVEPARQDDMQPWRSLAADLLEQPHGRSSSPDLVNVVEDDHEIVLQRFLERFAQQRRNRGGPLRLVAVGADRRLCDLGELAADRRKPRLEGACDPEHEDREVCIVRADCVPQAADRFRPRPERDGLPVAGVGEHDRQSTPERHFELLEEAAPDNELLRRRSCGRELSASRHGTALRRHRQLVARRRRIDIERHGSPLDGAP